ncbi:MAG: DUF4838 domain-containing protein [Lentisphaerae bacterium]|jgi:hypothetical protein|nr:DUF4838 domain-containing protein [Lentisphaerota bacterium]MBT4819410.1 DUF4838 domain-containing protein [Lentisphaerota bacterium]MBT5612648.1 DUF4838 domain-containing protein [Lentisphaerota bacterium]MBT7053672.1 DUF4838 domain-containing protein [Lentisphaerota bacterium]MBT7841133.1 DUF4838 domain-containing protein [Lentisphaerota bacterium]
MAGLRLTATISALMCCVCVATRAQEPGGEPGRMVLVENGEARCRIFVAHRPGVEYAPQKWNKQLPGSWLYLAAHDFAATLRKSTGADIEVITEPEKAREAQARDDGLIAVHLGLTEYVRSLGLDLPSPHGFLITFPDDRNMVIAGVPIESKGFNTVYGVHHFLRRNVGVRWLFPGELGECVPELGTLAVPTLEVRETPSFPFRGSSGWGKVYVPSDPERWEPLYWHVRTGGTFSLHLRFSHNIGNIIDPDLYRDSHPEFFPVLEGKRVVPPPAWKTPKGYVTTWEPCYTAEGIVEEAAARIIEHFDNHPDCYTYSLGVNDGGQICRCDTCRDKNRNFPDWCESQSYYEWVNEVVRIVRRKYPDRYFGLLAYAIVYMPPEGIVLDDHIVPVLAWDMRYFCDPEIARAKSEEYVNKWKAVSPALGWWDYTFEGSYFVPPYQAGFVARQLKKLYHNSGLRFYYDEVHPGRYFKNAPQEYLKRALLWNIDRDTADILGEWFELAVGRDAAPHMAKYFQVWEALWTDRMVSTEWFKERCEGERVAPFLQRMDCRYMDVLTRDDVRRAEKHLDAVVRLAGTDAQKKRARFFQDYFMMAKSKFFLPHIASVAMSRDHVKLETKGTVCRFGFDSDFETWSTWKSRHSTAKHSHDPNEGKSGKGCLQFDNSDSLAGSLAFTNTFPMPEAGKAYRVSVWCKTSNETELALNVWLKTKQGPFGKVPGSKGQFKYIHKAVSAGDWQELSVCIAAPEEGWEEVAEIYCFASGTPPVGSLFWFDDFSIEEVALKAE